MIWLPCLEADIPGVTGPSISLLFNIARSRHSPGKEDILHLSRSRYRLLRIHNNPQRAYDRFTELPLQVLSEP